MVMEHEEKKDTSSYREIDPFTAFMFGKPRSTDENNHTEHVQHESFSEDDWFLRRKNRTHWKKEKEEENETDNMLNDFLNQVNIEELMKNIDLFIETAQEFKPLWKKASPIINKWLK